jgi:hypothetical protein
MRNLARYVVEKVSYNSLYINDMPRIMDKRCLPSVLYIIGSRNVLTKEILSGYYKIPRLDMVYHQHQYEWLQNSFYFHENLLLRDHVNIHVSHQFTMREYSSLEKLYLYLLDWLGDETES